MHHALRLLLAACLVALLATDSQAQDKAPDPFGDDQVRKFIALALDNLTRALCEKNKPCAPATAEERAKPPIAVAEARLVLQRGALSGLADQCGLDWRKQNFLPMMDYWRNAMKKSERQMALIGLIHGITQGMMEGRSQKDCPAQTRNNVDRQLSFRPPAAVR